MNEKLKWVLRIVFKNTLLFILALTVLCLLLAFIPDRYAPPFFERFIDYVTMAFTFDFGLSMQTGYPVMETVADRAINTFVLLFLTVILVLVIAVPFGIMGALYKNNPFQKVAVYLIYGLSTIPVLLWATILTLLIFLGLDQVLMFNDLNDVTWSRAVVIVGAPVIALTIGDGMLYDVYRTVRERIATIKSQPWVKSLKSRGRNIHGHLARGLIEPLATVISSKLTYLISGAIVVEYIFNWPGLGMLIWDAIKIEGAKDYPVIIASVMVLIILVIGSTLLKDFIHLTLNPHHQE